MIKIKLNECNSHLENLLITTGAHFRNLTFPQLIPKSPNALVLYKWYKQEISFACQQIDLCEQNCAKPNVCKKGCAGCCQQLIATTDVEMLAMKISVQNLSPDLKDKLRKRTSEVCNFLIQNEFNINSPMESSNFEIQKKMQEKYFNLGVSCPLLNESNECLFYDVRPLLCWSYRCYNDSNACSTQWNYDESINYDSLSSIVMERLCTAKLPKRGLILLPFALLELL